MGKSASAPPTPDYVGAAKQQGKDNLTAARESNVMSNPNMITPFGKQTVTYSSPTFDESGYNAALEKFNNTPGINRSAYTSTGGGGGDSGGGGASFDQAGYDAAVKAQGSAPDRAAFTSGGGQPTVTQTLNPQAQSTLESQQRVQTALAN